MAETNAPPPQELTTGQPVRSGPWALAWRRLRRKRLAVLAIAVIAVFYIAGFLAPVLAPYDYQSDNLQNQNAGPSWQHPLGTDGLGRDELSRVIWSARTTTIVTVAAVVTGTLALAVGLGLLAGYVGGKVDTAIMRSGEVFASLPGLPMLILINVTMRPRVDDAVDWLESHISTDALRTAVEEGKAPELTFLALLALLAVAGVAGLTVWLRAGAERRSGAWLLPALVTGVVVLLLWAMQGIFASPGSSDYFLVFGALALFSWVGGARVIRSQVLALRETEYVLAARAMGAGTWRVLTSHLLPNVSPIIIVSVSAALGAIAGSEIALTFLGVGVQEPTPSFGAMIFDAVVAVPIRQLGDHPHLLIAPGVVVALLIFSFNLLGDALNDALTPRAR